MRLIFEFKDFFSGFYAKDEEVLPGRVYMCVDAVRTFMGLGRRGKFPETVRLTLSAKPFDGCYRGTLSADGDLWMDYVWRKPRFDPDDVGPRGRWDLSHGMLKLICLVVGMDFWEIDTDQHIYFLLEEVA